MYKRHKVGICGEEIAKKYLIQNNYKIIDKNIVTKFGEIDIIAKEKQELVFIEVKARTNNLYGTPAQAVNNKKAKHIYNSTNYYIIKNKLQNKPIRIDVIEIYIDNENYKINHIKKAILEKPFKYVYYNNRK